MLNVQRLLRSGQTPADLTAEFALRVTPHPELPLMIFNYDQIESRPKTHPVIVECRGLVLEAGTWNVVARAFPRFFNWGEVPDEDAAFQWQHARCQEKCDGSLAIVFEYGGRVFMNTRGSFAQGPVQNGRHLTWEQLFWSALAHPTPGDAKRAVAAHLPSGCSAVFELCSPLNRIVRRYEHPTAYLLSAFHNETGAEEPPERCDAMADAIGARRPIMYQVGRHADLVAMLDAEADPTFEGFVIADKAGVRKKVKSARYVQLHHIKGEGDTAFSPQRLVPFILKGGDEEELLLYLGQLVGYYTDMKRLVHQLRDDVFELWGRHHAIESQKEFALAVKDYPGALFLFEARKRGCHPRDVWAERAEAFLVKWLDGKLPVPEPVLTPGPSVPCASDGDVIVTDWPKSAPIVSG